MLNIFKKKPGAAERQQQVEMASMVRTTTQTPSLPFDILQCQCGLTIPLQRHTAPTRRHARPTTFYRCHREAAHTTEGEESPRWRTRCACIPTVTHLGGWHAEFASSCVVAFFSHRQVQVLSLRFVANKCSCLPLSARAVLIPGG
jgi:hypothetical protein